MNQKTCKNGLGPKTAKTPPLPTNWYAEDVQRALHEHNRTCKDPNCTHNFALHHPELKTVAMLQTGEMKRIFLAFYGEGAAHPYKPYAILNLATGEEIASSFDEEGRVSCMFSAPRHTDDPICLTLLCHQKGIDISVGDANPDSVTLVCAEPTCRQPIRFEGFDGTVELAPEPKAKYPNVFCRVHGIQPAYVICEHVGRGATPLVLAHPTKEDYGIALCGPDCSHEMMEGDRSKVRTACVKSLTEILGYKLTNGKETAVIETETVRRQ